MTSTTNQASLADKGQAIALRLLAKAGGHDLLKNPAIRSKVERALYQGSKSGFKAQTVAGRAFTKKAGSGDAARTAPTKPRREFDLTPTEDQETIAAVAAELADELLRPAAAKADAERALPDEIRAQATEMGLTLVGVPAELGGIAEERSAVMTALVLEQLARGDMGLAVAIMAPAAVATAIAGYGTSAQQETYLPAFTDEKKPAVAALALAEAGPLADPRTPATTATRDDARPRHHRREGARAVRRCRRTVRHQRHARRRRAPRHRRSRHRGPDDERRAGDGRARCAHRAPAPRRGARARREPARQG